MPIFEYQCKGCGKEFEALVLPTTGAPACPACRTELDALGDSLVVVGGEGLWNVHVHVDDAGAAVEAGIAAGRPSRIRITHKNGQPVKLAEAAAQQQAEDQEFGLPHGFHAVVSSVPFKDYLKRWSHKGDKPAWIRVRTPRPALTLRRRRG